MPFHPPVQEPACETKIGLKKGPTIYDEMNVEVFFFFVIKASSAHVFWKFKPTQKKVYILL